MKQTIDKTGAADYLNMSVATVTYRINHGTFPPPDEISPGVEWWYVETLDKYMRSLAAKKAAATRRKNKKKG